MWFIVLGVIASADTYPCAKKRSGLQNVHSQWKVVSVDTMFTNILGYLVTEKL